MELKDFISETIYQIATGVKESMEKCKDLDIIVNPNIYQQSNNELYIPEDPSRHGICRRITPIEIDVSVAISNSSENSAGGKIGISVFGVGGNIKDTDNTMNTNRIKFSVPVSLPVTEMQDVYNLRE
ncbi:hypothetical protein [Segatella paludivivens]|uniref:hypothetical protein n=1 Tax=Segatella paludivivens TaxID=185294 RepID=UPI00035C5A84|nr:hypothetical protein [Segatella paludivivens]